MSTRRPTILIADDNPQILELLEAYFDSSDYEVRLASDGQEALDAVAAERPDLLLLDVMMPKRSGFEVCRILKAEASTRDLPILMVTALNEAGDVERASECGADDFLSKPVNKIELIARVRNLLVRSASNEGEEPAPEAGS